MAVARLLVVALGMRRRGGMRGYGAGAGRDRDGRGVHAAIQQREGGAACALLAEKTRSTLEEEESRPCDEAILTLGLPDGGVAAGASEYNTERLDHHLDAVSWGST
jgi:hypothetical protein